VLVYSRHVRSRKKDTVFRSLSLPFQASCESFQTAH
jgi:hypothetical protein